MAARQRFPAKVIAETIKTSLISASLFWLRKMYDRSITGRCDACHRSADFSTTVGNSRKERARFAHLTTAGDQLP